MQMIINLQNKQIGTETNSVNARELHSYIQAKQHFANWIVNRIKKYDFQENKDYIIIETKKAGNNATLKEYYITLNMAKELSMVENNEKGRQARRWFIEIAEKYQQTIQHPTHHQIIGYKSQLSQHRKKITQLEAKIMQLQDHDVIASTVVRALQTADKYKKLQHQVKELAPLLN